MRRNTALLLVRFSSLAAVFMVGACASKNADESLPEVVVLTDDSGRGNAARKVDFRKEVAPILRMKCVSCHYDHAPLTGLSFQRRESLLNASGDRPVLTPGDPEKSTLFLVTVMPEYFVEAMPPTGHRLNDDEMWKIYHWIKQGAEWPSGLDLMPPPDA